MENILYLFAITPHDLGMLIAVIAGCWLISLIIFWVFYSLCSLAAGLSMRLGYTYGIVLFLISIFFVFRDLKEYFVWWHYTPGPTNAVIADAVLVLAICLLKLILMWAIWPKPKPAEAVLL